MRIILKAMLSFSLVDKLAQHVAFWNISLFKPAIPEIESFSRVNIKAPLKIYSHDDFLIQNLERGYAL